MRNATRIADIEAAERFLQGEKHLHGAPPEFGPSLFKRQYREWFCTWPIADENGIVERGALRFVIREIGHRPSISLTFGDNPLYRLDLVPSDECHANPLFAAKHGLPPKVCGNHLHSWEANREFVASQDIWKIPCREPLPPQVRRFEQAFAWLADRLGMVLTPDQRAFEPPRILF